ncbi:amidase [Chelativorans sp. Marseille-P2723]|uniref:amidase n=1 Tax=Chelativorans sp. Marseille-P2723 TaxID=2709133 RepID=UPI00156E3B51|nr:amidase [Chelativorans sp. Marseille-P2723]
MTASCTLDMLDMVQGVRNGDFTAEALAREALDRLATLGQRYNAIIELQPDAALEAARSIDLARARGEELGLLAGAPLAHKDLLYRAGRRCTGGSIIRKNFVPDTTATALERLDQSGALDLGTLHLAEFAFSPTGYNRHYGHGRSPWNTEYGSGGSSSGSGAAVAARLVPVALGSDTGGSLRHPSAMSGVVGLRPTIGLVPRYGSMPAAPSLDVIGPLARSVRDVARVMRVIAGFDPRDPASVNLSLPVFEEHLGKDLRGISIAVPTGYYRDHTDAEVQRLMDESLAVLKEAGAVIVETTPPDMDLINSLMTVVMTAEAASLHRQWLSERGQDYGAQVRSRIIPGYQVSAVRYLDALRMRAGIIREWIETAMRHADMVHIPTLPVPVPSISATTELPPEEVAEVIGLITTYTRGIAYLGLPALSIPCGFTSNGMPAAFQLVGRPFAEPVLFRAGDAYQRVTDFHKLMPPGCDA